MSNILVVEDEPWLGELYCHVLARAGYKVTWCRDGYEAIERLDESRYDVLLLDIVLPWANGLQLLHELSSHSDLAHIPVIVYSNALPENMDSTALRPYGVRAAIDKAKNNPQQLPLIIKRVLDDA